MFNIHLLRCATLAFVVALGGNLLGQEPTFSPAPLLSLPQTSSERLGTGVPSRRPKTEGQRPVFTIQSGGPVALPLPQFRPIRETTPANVSAGDAKNSLPILEQTRPWQRAGSEPQPPRDRTGENVAPNRVVPPQPAPLLLRTATPSTTRPEAKTSPGGFPAEQRLPPRDPPRPTAKPQTTSVAPARGLN